MLPPLPLFFAFPLKRTTKGLTTLRFGRGRFFYFIFSFKLKDATFGECALVERVVFLVCKFGKGGEEK